MNVVHLVPVFASLINLDFAGLSVPSVLAGLVINLGAILMVFKPPYQREEGPVPHYGAQEIAAALGMMGLTALIGAILYQRMTDLFGWHIDVSGFTTRLLIATVWGGLIVLAAHHIYHDWAVAFVCWALMLFGTAMLFGYGGFFYTSPF